MHKVPYTLKAGTYLEAFNTYMYTKKYSDFLLFMLQH